MVGRLRGARRAGNGYRSFSSALLALLLLLGLVVPGHTVLAAEADIGRILITNVDDRSFAISWVTDQPADGYVRYGANPNGASAWTRVDDVRGPGYRGYTHYISVDNGDPGQVLPSTTYYFSVTSTTTTVATAGQSSLTVKTGATLSAQPPPPNFFSGIVRYSNASPAPGVLVFVTLRRVVSGQPTVTSQMLSGLTDASGAFTVDVSAARIATQQGTGDYFRLSTTSPDEKVLYELDDGQGGPVSGTADGNTTSAGSAAPVQPRVFTLPTPAGPLPTVTPTSALVLTPPPPILPTLSPLPTAPRPSPTPPPTLGAATATPPTPHPTAASTPAPSPSPVSAISPTATPDETPTVGPTATLPTVVVADNRHIPPSILAVIGGAVLLVSIGLALAVVGLLEAARR